MAKKMFAIKIPSKLKRTMELISRESGHPLSKLYFDDIERSTIKYLGVVLLHNLDITNVTKRVDIRELKNTSHLKMYFLKNNISPVKEFVDLMEKSENRNRIKGIFPGVTLAEKAFSYEDINVEDLCEFIGERYLNTNRDITSVDLDGLKDIFFQKMLGIYFDTMAIGTGTQLETVWSQGQGKLELFKREILRDFDETFQSVVVEPIIMDEEAIEEETEKMKMKRMKIPIPATTHRYTEAARRPKRKRKVRTKQDE